MSTTPSAEEEYFNEYDPEPEPDVPGVAELILAMSTLTEKQRFVIELRYGLKGDEPLTLEEIAELMGVSHVAVVRIEQRAIDTMKRSVGNEDPPVC